MQKESPNSLNNVLARLGYQHKPNSHTPTTSNQIIGEYTAQEAWDWLRETKQI